MILCNAIPKITPTETERLLATLSFQYGQHHLHTTYKFDFIAICV